MAQQSARLPRGLRNNNPLNIRISGTNWLGKLPLEKNTDGSFEQFDTIIHGIRAAMINVRTYINKYHCNTPQTIIHRWAPPSDGNNTARYVDVACQLACIPKGRIISPRNRSEFCRLLWAMACVECGQTLDLELFHAAYALL